VSIGLSSPKPCAVKRLELIPLEIKYFLTALARLSDNLKLLKLGPALSVCPSIRN